MTDLTKANEWLKDADAVIVTAGNGMAKGRRTRHLK